MVSPLIAAGARLAAHAAAGYASASVNDRRSPMQEQEPKPGRERFRKLGEALQAPVDVGRAMEGVSHSEQRAGRDAPKFWADAAERPIVPKLEVPKFSFGRGGNLGQQFGDTATRPIPKIQNDATVVLAKQGGQSGGEPPGKPPSGGKPYASGGGQFERGSRNIGDYEGMLRPEGGGGGKKPPGGGKPPAGGGPSGPMPGGKGPEPQPRGDRGSRSKGVDQSWRDDPDRHLERVRRYAEAGVPLHPSWNVDVRPEAEQKAKPLVQNEGFDFSNPGYGEYRKFGPKGEELTPQQSRQEHAERMRSGSKVSGAAIRGDEAALRNARKGDQRTAGEKAADAAQPKAQAQAAQAQQPQAKPEVSDEVRKKRSEAAKKAAATRKANREAAAKAAGGETPKRTTKRTTAKKTAAKKTAAPKRAAE